MPEGIFHRIIISTTQAVLPLEKLIHANTKPTDQSGPGTVARLAEDHGFLPHAEVGAVADEGAAGGWIGAESVDQGGGRSQLVYSKWVYG